MGRLFHDFLGGSLYYTCANCDTYLSNHREIISKSFRAGPGIAWLFKHVVNIREAPTIERRHMITGSHYVKDIFCKKCDQKVGWVYELAENEDQQYKEGKFILERNLLKDVIVTNPKLAERWDLDTNQHVPDPPPTDDDQDQEAATPSTTLLDTTLDSESQGAGTPLTMRVLRLLSEPLPLPTWRTHRIPGTPLPSEGREIFEYPASTASLDVNLSNSPRHSTTVSEIRASLRDRNRIENMQLTSRDQSLD